MQGANGSLVALDSFMIPAVTALDAPSVGPQPPILASSKLGDLMIILTVSPYNCVCDFYTIFVVTLKLSAYHESL